MRYIESAGSGFSKATLTNNRHGSKVVKFKAIEHDEHSGLLDVHVSLDGDNPLERDIVATEKDAVGNDLAMAMDILTNLDLPIGTEFELKINFTLPEGEQWEITK